jgi:hypothetical protein
VIVNKKNLTHEYMSISRRKGKRRMASTNNYLTNFIKNLNFDVIE